ncbi:ABC transporter permease [uncultured Cohaesibacter sp.]|uniref:ABC transporter permease n=1 Tax=uncultured Cohaesibacter sp. TaxID=1002546 RepID=UPI00292E5ACA|nr:ABC transporter permease [uncultured Cohaesibacter sp.]
MRKLFAICTVVLVIVALWYAAAVKMNAKWAYDQAARAKVELSFSELVKDTWSQERPVLPAPHQVVKELWGTTVMKKVTSKRSLIFHGWITLEATLLGFAVGTLLGILLSVGIIYIRAMDMSVMPWAIASQTVPILAIAPMIIVVLNSVGIQGLIPKAIISAYLSFFPVLVGMVKGLRSPDHMQLDLLKTYNASKSDAFFKLRLPSSVPYLFTSMKVGIAASLVGTIVGELPTGAIRGLGARLLTGSYYGQTIQMWAALFAAAILAASLVAIVGATEKTVLKRMGMIR